MRLLTLLFTLLLALPVLASDYAREKKWADEILPSVLTGDPVWLEQANGHKFLGLYTEAPKAKAGLIVVHGMGVHPDWGLIAPLRQRLPDLGYATLSVQMPVLKADAKGEDYPPTFDEAAERIRIVLDFMKTRGYKQVALVTHSMAASMTARFFEKYPNADAAAWVAIGAPTALDYSKLKLPVLDMYGENDFPALIQAAKTRTKGLSGNKKSAQVMVPKANHFFEGQDDQLVSVVKDYLDKTL